VFLALLTSDVNLALELTGLHTSEATFGVIALPDQSAWNTASISATSAGTVVTIPKSRVEPK
jgi:hypothetical protein